MLPIGIHFRGVSLDCCADWGGVVDIALLAVILGTIVQTRVARGSGSRLALPAFGTLLA